MCDIKKIVLTLIIMIMAAGAIMAQNDVKQFSIKSPMRALVAPFLLVNRHQITSTLAMVSMLA